MTEPHDGDDEARAGRRLLIMLIAGLIMIVIGISLVFALIH